MNDGTGQGQGTEHGKDRSGGEEMAGNPRDSAGEREGEPVNGEGTEPPEPMDVATGGEDPYARYGEVAPTVNRNGTQGVETGSEEVPSTKSRKTSQAGSVRSIASDADQSAQYLEALTRGNLELNQQVMEVEALRDDRVSLKRTLAEAMAHAGAEIGEDDGNGETGDVFLLTLDLEASLPNSAKERVKSSDKTKRQDIGETIARRAGEALSTMIPTAMVDRGECIVGMEVRGAETFGQQKSFSRAASLTISYSRGG